MDGLTLHVYKPSRKIEGLLLVLHGNSRNAADYCRSAMALADERALMVIAPHFDARRFPPSSYHRGNLVDRRQHPRPPSEWTTRFVPRIIEWGTSRCEYSGIPVYLVGFSAGAQYLSRVAAFERLPGVVSIVIASPSSHVLPLLGLPPQGERVPYGMTGLVDDPETARQMLKAYLRRQITLYIGSEDDDPRDPLLTRNPAALRQGRDRLERASFTYQTARTNAKRHGWTCNWRLIVEADIGHSPKRLLSPQRFTDVFAVAETADC